MHKKMEGREPPLHSNRVYGNPQDEHPCTERNVSPDEQRNKNEHLSSHIDEHGDDPTASDVRQIDNIDTNSSNKTFSSPTCTNRRITHITNINWSRHFIIISKSTRGIIPFRRKNESEDEHLDSRHSPGAWLSAVRSFAFSLQTLSKPKRRYLKRT